MFHEIILHPHTCIYFVWSVTLLYWVTFIASYCSLLIRLAMMALYRTDCRKCTRMSVNYLPPILLQLYKCCTILYFMYWRSWLCPCECMHPALDLRNGLYKFHYIRNEYEVGSGHDDRLLNFKHIPNGLGFFCMSFTMVYTRFGLDG